MLQQHQVPTLKDLVNKLLAARDIPSLTEYQAKESLLKSRKLLDATVGSQAVKQSSSSVYSQAVKQSSSSTTGACV